MRRSLNISIFASVILVSSLHAITLKDVVKKTIDNNPNIQKQLKVYNQKAEELKTLQGDYKPTVNLNAEIGKERANSVTETSDSTKNLNPNSVSLTVKENLFNGYKTSNGIKQSKLELKAAGYNYLSSVDNVSLEVIEAYLEILRKKKHLDIKEEENVIIEKIYVDMSSKYNSGITRVSDLMEVKSKLALAYINYISLENDFNDALATFQSVYGEFLSPSDLEERKYKFKIPTTFSEIKLKALKYNPRIISKEYNNKAALFGYKITRGQYLPSVDFELKGSSTHNSSIFEKKSENVSGKVVLNYNLYNGGKDNAASHKAISFMHQKNEELEAEKLLVLKSIQYSWNKSEANNRKKAFIDTYLETSKKKLDSYYKEFNLGRRSLIDLLSATSGYYAAKGEVVDISHEMKLSYYRLLNGMGLLSQEFYRDIALGVNINANKDEILESYKPDSLIISNDRDKDSILNKNDMCYNSDSKNTTTWLGCKKDKRLHKKLSFVKSNIATKDSFSFASQDKLTFNDNLELINAKDKIISSTYTLKQDAYLLDTPNGDKVYFWTKGMQIKGNKNNNGWVNVTSRLDKTGKIAAKFNLWIKSDKLSNL